MLWVFLFPFICYFTFRLLPPLIIAVVAVCGYLVMSKDCRKKYFPHGLKAALTQH